MFNNASNYHEWTYLIIYHGSLAMFFLISMGFYQPVDHNHILPGLLHVWIYHIHLRRIVVAVQWNIKQKHSAIICMFYWMHCLYPYYSDAIMSAMVSQISGISIICSTVCSGADQRKHQSCASMAFVRGIHRWRWRWFPLTWKMFPFDDVIMHVWAKTRSNNYWHCERSLFDNSIQNQVQAKPWTRDFGC